MPERRKSGHCFILVTKNREVINDVLLNDLDAHQIERVRKALHLLFEKCKSLAPTMSSTATLC